MFGIIVLGTITITLLIITIATISTKEYPFSISTAIGFLLFSYMTFDITTDYIQKYSPNFIYRTNSYKVLEYSCDDKPMVKVLENDNDLFYVPESLLIVRCTGEIERK